MKTNKQIVRLFFVLAFLFSNFFPTGNALAYSFNIPGGWGGSMSIDVPTIAKQAASEMENRYGFNQDEWRRAKRKVYAPRVEISFDNTNPKSGEKVTAHAVPEFFKNDPQNLYYTWYIIHTDTSEIDNDSNPLGATNSIEEGKIEASKYMARGDYDSSLDGASYSDSGADPDRDGWPASDEARDDKMAAPYGGADGVGGITDKTKRHKSASEYCKSHAEGENPSKENCNYLSDSSYVSTLYYYTLDSSQTDFYCKECYDYFSDHSSELPSSTCTGNRNQCCYNPIPKSNLECSTGDPPTYYKCAYDSATSYCDSATYCGSDTTCQNAMLACYDNFKTCNKNTVQGCIDDKVDECVDSHTSNNEEIIFDVSRCYKHQFGVNKNPVAFSNDDGSGLDYPVDCEHKWEDISGSYVSGSGTFPTGEEEKWKTDPNDPDTDGDGFLDEADIIGLGQENFTWTYQPGDRVGVVVEGTSMLPTDEKTAYYKIMWGYMDVCDSTKTKLLSGDQCDDSDDYGYGFLATKAPGEEYSDEKIKASLSYSPENPVADPTSDDTMADADEITVTSSIDNTDLSPQNIYYTWYIERKESIEGGNPWKKISNLEDSFTLSGSGPSSGLGLSSFSFTPKKDFLKGISDDLVNLRVTVSISRTSEPTTYESDVLERSTPRKGFASVEIPVNKNGISIKLYKVNINESGKAELGDEICGVYPYRETCPVTKSQMVAAKISGSEYSSGNSQFSWNLDGDPLYQPVDYSVFESWSGISGQTVFFPITKEAGELEDISVTATPKTKLQVVNIGRSLMVVDPLVFIKSSDENISWPKEYSVESQSLKDITYTRASDSLYEAQIFETASYALESIPDYFVDNNNPNISYSWTINGEDVEAQDFDPEALGLSYVGFTGSDGSGIEFTSGPDEGSTYTLAADVKRYWSEEETNVLYKAWGISPETLESSASLDVETVDTYAIESDEGAAANPKQVLAVIGTHIPHYTAYVLRLILTLLVMLSVSAFFYGLTQKLSLYEEK